MAKSNIPRIQGDDFQARWLWLQLCHLLKAQTKVEQVVYEANNAKGFDDVAVFYKDGMVDEYQQPLWADFYQVKFHVHLGGAVRWESLTDPAFINASSVSLLQRLRDFQQVHEPYRKNYRCTLYSPWPIHPDDRLAEIVSSSDGKLDWERLKQGGNNSENGKIRKAWREHLGLDSDIELEKVLSPLRIKSAPSLDSLRRELNNALAGVGLKPVDDTSLVHIYDELTRKLFQIGTHKFDRNNIEAICKKEGLWLGHSIFESGAYRLGIRSFSRWAENLQDETDEMICFLNKFDGRIIKSVELWNEVVLPELFDFFENTLKNRESKYHLWLSSTHASIAFAAGYFLHSKRGFDVVPIQATSSGLEIWRPNRNFNQQDYPEFVYDSVPLSETGTHIALALSVSNDVLEDVTIYVKRFLPQVGRIIFISLPAGPNSRGVVDGTHAFLIAQQVSQLMKTHRTAEERLGILHIFASAPNGLLFFLGQLSHSFGSCSFYEYLFENNSPGAYELSITLNS